MLVSLLLFSFLISPLFILQVYYISYKIVCQQ
nr:MAG TPA: hypothetical protein [Caudoviricetes sp.]